MMISNFVRAGISFSQGKQGGTYGDAGARRSRMLPIHTVSQQWYFHAIRRTYVDGHALLGGKSNLGHLGNVLGSLHVCSVTSSSENNGNLGVWIDIIGSNQSTGSIVDERGKLGRDLESLEGIHKHGSDISAFNVGCAETFSPSDQFSVVDPVLGAWVGELSSA